MLVGRYVLSGPQPCELVDVKIELSFRYTTVTPSGSLFRAVENLQLVRAEDSYQRHGMTVRHVIDDSSPLKGKSRDELEAMNAQFCLTVVSERRVHVVSVCDSCQSLSDLSFGQRAAQEGWGWGEGISRHLRMEGTKNSHGECYLCFVRCCVLCYGFSVDDAFMCCDGKGNSRRHKCLLPASRWCSCCDNHGCSLLLVLSL